jgi:hypothetical protein
MGVEIIVKGPVQGQAHEARRIERIHSAALLARDVIGDLQRHFLRRGLDVDLRQHRSTTGGEDDDEHAGKANGSLDFHSVGPIAQGAVVWQASLARLCRPGLRR